MDDEELVSSALALADKFYVMLGNISLPGFKYYESNHPTEQLMWQMACKAFDHITYSDVDSALDDITDGE